MIRAALLSVPLRRVARFQSMFGGKLVVWWSLVRLGRLDSVLSSQAAKLWCALGAGVPGVFLTRLAMPERPGLAHIPGCSG